MRELGTRGRRAAGFRLADLERGLAMASLLPFNGLFSDVSRSGALPNNTEKFIEHGTTGFSFDLHRAIGPIPDEAPYSHGNSFRRDEIPKSNTLDKSLDDDADRAVFHSANNTMEAVEMQRVSACSRIS